MATTYNNLYLDLRTELRRAGDEEATQSARELVCAAAAAWDYARTVRRHRRMAELRTEEPEAVILEKNRKLRRRTVSASTVTAILLLVLVCLNSWQSRQSARLREAMGQMDIRMEMEFEGARVPLSEEFREAAYTPLLARELERLQTAALYGYYFDGFSGGDAQWCPLSQALGELNDPAIFALLTEEDCRAIADFLKTYSYRNDPELTEADAAAILDRVEAVLAEYHGAG